VALPTELCRVSCGSATRTNPAFFLRRASPNFSKQQMIDTAAAEHSCRLHSPLLKRSTAVSCADSGLTAMAMPLSFLNRAKSTAKASYSACAVREMGSSLRVASGHSVTGIRGPHESHSRKVNCDQVTWAARPRLQ
jgi:hypothetical protein